MQLSLGIDGARDRLLALIGSSGRDGGGTPPPSTEAVRAV